MLKDEHEKVKLLKNIRCPWCKARHYFVRPETKRYLEDGREDILCDCGHKYAVIQGKNACIVRKVM